MALCLQTHAKCPNCQSQISEKKFLYPDDDGSEGYFNATCPSCRTIYAIQWKLGFRFKIYRVDSKPLELPVTYDLQIVDTDGEEENAG
jgi:phage FluMu protein Com